MMMKMDVNAQCGRELHLLVHLLRTKPCISENPEFFSCSSDYYIFCFFNHVT
jgi:hypothetical protein